MILTPPTSKQHLSIFAAVLVVTLVAGLHPKGYDFKNHVETTADGEALKFSKFGVAFTKPIIDSVTAGVLNEAGFEILLAFGPEAEKQQGFALIAQIYSGSDHSQLVVGRWSDHLIVMNGDDYRNRSNHPRISARLSMDQRQHGGDVRIKSGPNGSLIEVRDQPVARRSDVALTMPVSSRPAQIVLGISATAQQPWAGQIRRFQIYQQGERSNPIVDFEMSKIVGNEVPNPGSAGGALAIPTGNAIVERRLLEWPINHQFEWNRSFLNDAVINLFGFVPFGMALTGALRMRGLERKRSIAWVLAICALTSLLIEFLQTWLPSRSSSALDLILNILGGMAGMIAWSMLFGSAMETTGDGCPEDPTAG